MTPISAPKPPRPAPPRKGQLRLVSDYDPRAAGANCDECPLNGFAVVPPTIVRNPQAIIVGMEPGFEEERAGQAFIGPSGQRLNASLARAGLERKRMNITNGILCRPRREPDRAKAMKCCAPRLQRELDALPKIPVLTMGKEAFAQTTGKKIRILLVRGFVWKIGQRYVFPTVHPAFLLRNDGKTSGDAWLPVFQKDLERAARFIVHKSLKLEEAPFTVPSSVAELKATLAKMGKEAALDIETTRDVPRRAQMICVGISDGKTTVVIPWMDQYAKPLDDFCRTHTIICHNGPAFDHIVLRRYGVRVRKWEDTLVGHHVFNGHMPQRLDHVVSVYLDSRPWKLDAGRRGAGNEEKGELLDVDDPSILYPYNALDAALTFRVWKAILPELQRHWAVYLHDKDKSNFCDEMQEIGIKIDLAMHQRLHHEMSEKKKRIKYELRKISGWKFNPNATRDIRKVLFSELKAPIYKRTKKTGAPSTDADVLEAFAKVRNQAYGAFCRKLLEYRKVHGRMKYLDIGPAGKKKPNGKKYTIIVEADGRIHPQWKACRPVTGRLSCSGPNLQNLEKGSGIRALYVAEDGWILVSFDMSQVEMRTAAYISGDGLFIAACESGDLHTANGKVLFPKEQSLWNDPKGKKCPMHKDGGDAFAECNCGKPFRDVSKNSGFAAVFYGTAETIYENLRAEGFQVKFQDVVTMLEAIKRAYKGYFASVEKRQAQVRETGHCKIDYVTGRERFFGRFPEITHLANNPAQATAAGAMNSRLYQMTQEIKKRGWGDKMRLVAQVHDQGIFEARLDLVGNGEMFTDDKGVTRPAIWADKCEKTIIKDIMAPPFTINGYKAPLPIEVKRGARWSDL